MFGSFAPTPYDLRFELLGMLGSDHEDKVLNAARQVEAARKRLGKTWTEILGI